MSKRSELALEWAKEWIADPKETESLPALLERFALHEIAMWRHDNEQDTAKNGSSPL